jgi:hypothetical protein
MATAAGGGKLALSATLAPEIDSPLMAASDGPVNWIMLACRNGAGRRRVIAGRPC